MTGMVIGSDRSYIGESEIGSDDYLTFSADVAETGSAADSIAALFSAVTALAEAGSAAEAVAGSLVFSGNLVDNNPFNDLANPTFKEAYGGSATEWYETVVGNGKALDRVRFLLGKTGLPTGTLDAVIYASTGTAGVDATPSGLIPLASSSTVINIATLNVASSVVVDPYDLFFSDGPVLTNGVTYMLGVRVNGGGTTNRVRIAGTSITVPGRNGCLLQSGVFTALTAQHISLSMFTSDATGTVDATTPVTSAQLNEITGYSGVGAVFDQCTATPNAPLPMINASTQRGGQSFLGEGKPFARAEIMLSKAGSPTGTMSAQLFAHSGTYGSGGIPTGSPLSTSTNTVSVASLTGTATFYTFDFPGDFTPLAGVAYFIVAVFTSTFSDASNRVQLDRTSIVASHGGNQANAFTAGAWTANAADALFKVYSQLPTSAADSLTVQAGTTFNDAVAESATATDSLSVTAIFASALSESGSGSDSLAASMVAVAAVSESGSAADALTAVKITTSALSESGSAADSITAVLTQNAVLAEAASGSDSIAASLILGAAVAEAASAADSISATAVLVSALSESGSAGNTFTATLILTAAVAESGSAADSLANTVLFVAAVSEAGSAADAVTAVISTSAALAEAGSATESLDGNTGTQTGTLSEAGNATESLASSAVFVGALAESGSGADALTASLSVISALAEAASSSEALTAVALFGAVLSEPGAAAESLAATATMSAAVLEPAAATESLSAGLITSAVLSEAGSAGNTLTATLSITVAVVEAAAAGNTVTAVVAVTGALQESGAAADSLAVQVAWSAAILEAGAADVILASGQLTFLALSFAADAEDDIRARIHVGGILTDFDPYRALSPIAEDRTLVATSGSRTFVSIGESRLTTPAGEDRTFNVGEQDRDSELT